MSKPTDDTLRDWIKYCSLSENPDYEMVIIAAKELLELRERTRWIPVLEKSPLFNIECLVYTSEGYQYVAALLVGGWWTEGVDEFLENVTHWMPLPEKPEVKE